ncbi:hypothetical protein M407DRAFT_247117 [Tulasnella calospora MUT 4182]|uniref:Uncharacterized protein n=1 Tax=Tulasnella calospora MUT 4182 TaxID=1051891 RepID=A0A0C3Q1C1_9AGAM|nr:hypothetical protein M407DRAFT_247117 [Tulasnella calospora MUT 4182]
MKDSTWLHEMRYREAHKGVSEIWKDLRGLIEKLQNKETAMLVGDIGRERQEAPLPPAALEVDNEPRLWGSTRPPADDGEAFDDSE